MIVLCTQMTLHCFVIFITEAAYWHIVLTWLALSKLDLNVRKTKYIIFHTL